jgi:hypothetical protein
MKTFLVLFLLFGLVFSENVHLLVSSKINDPLGNLTVFTYDLPSGKLVSSKIFPVQIQVLNTDGFYHQGVFHFHANREIYHINPKSREIKATKVNPPLRNSFSVELDQMNEKLISIGGYKEGFFFMKTDLKTGETKEIGEINVRGIVPQKMRLSKSEPHAYFTNAREFRIHNYENGQLIKSIDFPSFGTFELLDNKTVYSVHHNVSQRRFVLNQVDLEKGSLIETIVTYPVKFAFDRFSGFQRTFLKGNFHYCLLTEHLTLNFYLIVTDIKNKTLQTIQLNGMDWVKFYPIAIGV